MESAPARAQSRIPPFRLSKTVQPAPHKGQRRWLPHFSGQSSSADAKNGAKKRVFPKCLLSPRGTRAAGHSVSTHTMLRAALKPLIALRARRRLLVSTHTMLRAALKLLPQVWTAYRQVVSTHTMLRAALKRCHCVVSCRNGNVSTHTMLRAALKQRGESSFLTVGSRLDTHNAACGIETKKGFSIQPVKVGLDTHNAACGIETA